MLTIPAEQLHSSSSSSSSSSNPFLCFPRNARLKKLVLKGGHRMRSALDPGNALVQFLQPARTEARLRVMSVLHDLEEVHFEVGLLKGAGECIRRYPFNYSML
eukprot:322026-Pelagomonas_calceolata.AAC.2